MVHCKVWALIVGTTKWLPLEQPKAIHLANKDRDKILLSRAAYLSEELVEKVIMTIEVQSKVDFGTTKWLPIKRPKCESLGKQEQRLKPVVSCGISLSGIRGESQYDHGFNPKLAHPGNTPTYILPNQ